MHSASILTLVTALGAVVNAAPAIDIKRATQTYTIPESAPFQEPGKLPVLTSGVDPVDFDMPAYDAFGYSPDSDQFKCHATCGLVMRVAGTQQKCDHPYAQPFVNFCFGPCLTLDKFKPYVPARKFKDACKLEVSKPRTTSATSAASPVASDTGSSSQASSTSYSPVLQPTASANPANPAKQSASASTSTFSTGTAIAQPDIPSATTTAAPTPTVTPANSGTVTAGAASISFNIVVAITVATFAIVLS